MSVILKPNSPVEAGTPLVCWRWVMLGVLLLAELLVLTIQFDSGVFDDRREWWARLLGQSSHVPPLAIAALVVALLYRGAQLRADLVRTALWLQREPNRLWWPYVFGHLGAFAVFYALSAVVLGGTLQASRYSEGWLAAWTVVGIAALLLWSAAVLPPRAWSRLGRGGAGPLLAGTAFGALAWFGGIHLRALWEPLSRGTFWMVVCLLKLVTKDIVIRPADFVIGTSRFKVAIAPQCSGYEGIGLVWVLLGVYLWRLRHELRFPRVFLLFPLGTAAIWLANILRIAALVLIGSYVSKPMARGGFHSQAGWLAFTAIGLGLVMISYRTRYFRAPETVANLAGSNLVAAYLAPLMSLIAMMMIALAMDEGPGFDRLYPLRILAAAFFLWVYRQEYRDLRWSGGRGGYGPALAIGGVVFALWMALEPVVYPAGLKSFPGGLAQYPKVWAAFWLAFRIAGSVIVVPLAEELAFRGFLVRRLISSDFIAVSPGRFTWPSFLISSVLFGALHGRWLAGTLAGLLYGLALYRRRELSDSVVAHATTNALIAAHVVTTGDWLLWC